MDENGLELSLGLAFSGSSYSPKGKGSSSSDLRAEEDNQGKKTFGEVKGYCRTAISVPQFDAVKPQEFFFCDLLKANAQNDGEIGIEGTTTNKRKMMFDEICGHKKNSRQTKCFDVQEDKPRSSNISMNSEECSVADNGVVAESEADGSTSRLVLFSSHVRIPAAPISANPNLSEVSQYGPSGREVEINEVDGKQRAEPEEGSSTPAEEDAGTMDNLLVKFAAVKPGMSMDLKFGGCGSIPYLPWVSTTGLGPNGRTISGVTYRCGVNLIRIICACHGSHMSPEEFVRHASEEKALPAASAQS